MGTMNHVCRDERCLKTESEMSARTCHSFTLPWRGRVVSERSERAGWGDPCCKKRSPHPARLRFAAAVDPPPQKGRTRPSSTGYGEGGAAQVAIVAESIALDARALDDRVPLHGLG